MLSRTAFSRYLTPGPKRVGATTLEEQAWCKWFAAEIYSGAGVIVECGPWLGSLTASYCEGLELNPRVDPPRQLAHVYDLFEWSEIFEAWSTGTEHAGLFRAGDSFEGYFIALHQRFTPYLSVRREDLSSASWDGSPIELLINDAAKSLTIADNLFRRFVPSLVPELGYVAHQDFLWPTDAYIQAFMFLARDSFVYEHTVPRSAMSVFRNVRRFDPIVLRGYDGERMEYDLIRDAFAWSGGTLTDVDPRLVRLCEAVTLRNSGYADDAHRLVHEHGLNARQGPPQYDFALSTLRSWGYTDLLPGGS